MSSGLLTQLEAYYESVDEQQAPISIDELTSIRAQIHELPIRPEPPSARLRLKPLWIAVATAAVILLIVGGLSALLRNTGGFEPIEQPEITPTLPEGTDGDAPLLIDSGELQTADGTIRWSRLQGLPRNLPADYRMIPLATTWGFALFDPGAQAGAIFDQDLARLWLSDDLMNWRLAGLPVEVEGTAAIGVVRDAFWLVTHNPSRVWVLANGAEWSGFDTPEVDERPGGFDLLSTTLGAPVEINGAVLFSVSHGLAFPARDLGIRSDCAIGAVRLNDGVFRMTGDTVECPTGGPVLRFTETDAGLRVTDEASGTELGEIGEATLENIESMAQEEGLVLTTLYRIDGESVTPIELATGSEPVLEAFVAGQVISTGDSILAYADGRVWRTTDGAAWTEISSPFFNDRPAGERALVTALTDRFVYTLVDVESSLVTEAWESFDGETWLAAPASPPPGTGLVRLETGWFATDGSMGDLYGDSWWMLAGDEWVSLEATGTQECFSAVPIALGGFTLLSGESCGPDTEDLQNLWLVTLDEE